MQKKLEPEYLNTCFQFCRFQGSVAVNRLTNNVFLPSFQNTTVFDGTKYNDGERRIDNWFDFIASKTYSCVLKNLVTPPYENMYAKFHNDRLSNLYGNRYKHT